LRIRVAALGALGDRAGVHNEIDTALQSINSDDGLLADLDSATRRIFESALRMQAGIGPNDHPSN
jgi:hypothetical protein